MAEKEYIEREAVLHELLYAMCGTGYQSRAMDAVHFVPAADVVEVVRCKDCKNAYINSFSAQSGIAVCRFLANRSNGELAIVQQDDFCSYGERKEQE